MLTNYTFLIFDVARVPDELPKLREALTALTVASEACKAAGFDVNACNVESYARTYGREHGHGAVFPILLAMLQRNVEAAEHRALPIKIGDPVTVIDSTGHKYTYPLDSVGPKNIRLGGFHCGFSRADGRANDGGYNRLDEHDLFRINRDFAGRK